MDGTEHEPTDANADGSVVPPADERTEKPISFDFKLRLGSRESTAALTGRGTGELVQLQPIDWDSFTGLRDDDAPREYKTDGDLPSLIVELANQIAGPDTLAQAALRMNELAANRADPEWKTDAVAEAEADAEPEIVAPEIVVATVEDDPMLSSVVGQILDEPTVEPAPAPAPVVPAAAAPVVPPVRAPVQEQPEGPIELPRIVALTPDLPSGEMAQALPSGPITIPPVSPSGPVMLTGAEAMALAAATPAPAPVDAPAPAAAAAPIMPLQLAKIERKPGAERPTKPVDFHALLGQSGLQPQAVKRRKKRHPFRAFFKLVVVLGVIGGGLFFGKKYVLDMRWDSELKPYAEAVADARELKWKKPVPVETLTRSEYGKRLAASVFGADADEDDLGGEWRAMGLLEGSLDLDRVGEYSASFAPVFYDPSDKTIYQLDDLPDEVHDHSLYPAMGMALLDQHFNWSEGLSELSPAERAGRVALIAGDANETSMRILDESQTDAERYAEARQEFVDDTLVDIDGAFVGAFDYPSDMMIGPGAEASGLFNEDVQPDLESRNTMIERSVPNDAAVLNGLRSATGSDDVGDSFKSAGMIYWYYVMAGRIPEQAAWNAAVVWDGDEIVVDSSPTGECVTATIAAVDEPGRLLVLGALQQWAATAPPESATTVTELGSERVQVHACDPGTAADTKLDAGVTSWGLADQEYVLVDDLDLAASAQRSCTINAIRNFGLFALPAGQEADDLLIAIQTSCAEA